MAKSNLKFSEAAPAQGQLDLHGQDTVTSLPALNWNRTGPVPQLKRRLTGSGHFGLPSLRVKIDGVRTVVSMHTDSDELAQQRSVVVLNMVSDGASRKEIHDWLLSVGRGELEVFIDQEIARFTKPGDALVGTVADLLEEYDAPIYAGEVRPELVSKQLEGLFRAAETALYSWIKVDPAQDLALSRVTLRKVPLRFLDARALAASTTLARSHSAGTLQESALRRTSELHYCLRSLFGGNFINFLKEHGVELPAGLVKLLELSPVRVKPPLFRPPTLEPLEQLFSVLAAEAKAKRLPLLVVLVFYGAVPVSAALSATKAWLDKRDHLTRPGCKPMPLPPEVWRWLHKRMPRIPHGRCANRRERTAACDLLRGLGAETWGKAPLVRLRKLGELRRASSTKNFAALLRQLGLKSADWFVLNHGKQELGAKAIAAIARLTAALGKYAG